MEDIFGLVLIGIVRLRMFDLNVRRKIDAAEDITIA
jgi:hypothetical protein